jgi:hypothetical protein
MNLEEIKTSMLIIPKLIQNSNFDDSYYLFLESVEDYKMWKAQIWYPFLSKLAYNYRELELSRSFIQMSRSEQDISLVLMQMRKR